MNFEDEDKKFKDYQKRIRDVEEENEEISLQLAKARQHIKRLRVERVILLEEIDDLRQDHRAKKQHQSHNNAESDSEMSVSESIMSDVKGGGNRKGGNNPTPRKKRDPNAPKGPGNVFFLYCRMERDNIKDEVPNESLGEVTRLLGQKWKALSKEEKQKYYDAYKKEQEDYESAMKSYTAAGGGVEGAAAVEAANKEKEGSKLNELDDEEEEIDMLQEEEDDDGDDDDDDDDDINKVNGTDEHLHVPLSIASPPSSITTDNSTPMPDTPQPQDS